jgi:sec-independent protein translocase protein TatB
MFDIAWSELLIIGVVALIVIGPKELPTVLRAVGQWMGKIRRMASEFQSQFQEAMREAEMADIKKQVDEMSAAASDLTNFGNFDPMETVRKEMEAATGDISLDKPAPPAAVSDASKSDGATPQPEPAPPAVPAAEARPSQAEPAAAVAQADVAIAPPPSEPKAGGGA